MQPKDKSKPIHGRDNDVKLEVPAIDLNRGCVIAIHPIGMRVHMYKDDPGVYLTVKAKPVPEQFAKEAGLPVEKYAKARQKMLRLAEARERITKEIEKEDADRDIDDYEIVTEVGGFKLIHIGLGRHQVIDSDGEPLHTDHLPKEQAERLLKGLTEQAA